MTENEMCREYGMAKNPLEQIKILADLNCISVMDVRKILTKNGITIPKNKRKRSWSDENEKELARMCAAGASVYDMSRRFGLDDCTIYDKINRLNLVRRNKDAILM